MDIALLTEGTYPHSFGGVSVWCDQLVRGMPQHDFQLVALAGSGSEKVSWTLPANVASLRTVALWDRRPTGRPPGRAGAARIGELIHDLIAALLVNPAPAPDQFGRSLRALYEFGREHDLRTALRGENALRALADAWWTAWPDSRLTPTVHDTLVASQLLESSLSPLAAPPPRAHVSHCVANGLAVLPALAAKWTSDTPIVLTEHGIYLRERYLGLRDLPYRWPVKYLYLAFIRELCSLAYREAAIIAPGNIYNRRWEERLGARPDLIRTVYNGVNPADFPPALEEPETPTVCWAGRIDPIKDLETLLRAFALVHEQLPAARLRLFGSAPRSAEDYRRRCVDLAQELGIGAVATFEGRIADIRDAYAAGHVVVLSSISEGFPYTVIEAMISGRACVGTDVGGVSEAIGDTGLVVGPRDPAAMATACLDLLGDDRRRWLLGGRARARALEFFTVDRAIGAFDDVYRSLHDTAPHDTAPHDTAPHDTARQAADPAGVADGAGADVVRPPAAQQAPAR
jgi:glycosyltransferase involved in cell wall biosynthesis